MKVNLWNDVLPSRAEQKSPLPLLWSIGAVWLAVFAALFSRHYFFLFDDFALLDQAGGTSAAGIFTSPLFGFYRPVVFLIIKALTAVFSWNSPMGYSIALAVLHGLNGMLFGHVLRFLGLSNLTVLFASGLFLLSPWSSEAYSWVSAMFDTTALFFLLLSALAYLRFLLKRSWLCLAVSAAGFLIALLCKENMLAFLPVFCLARVGLGRGRVPKPVGLEFLLFAAVAALYLATRASVVGALAGSYGDLRGLFAHAEVLGNLERYALTLIWVGGKSFPGAFALSLIFAAFALIALIRAFVWRPLLAAALSLTFVVSLVPVLWNSSRLTSSDAGRLLYAPAVFFCALVGVGYQAFRAASIRGRHPARKLILGLVILTGLAGAAASSFYQANIWRCACGLSKQTVAYVLRHAHKAPKNIYIKNLPFLFIEGPFILKSNAFPLYARHRLGLELRPIRCDVVYISYKDIQSILPCGPEPGGAVRDKGPGDELVLDLPLEELRGAARRT